MKNIFLTIIFSLFSVCSLASNNVTDYGAIPNDGLDDTAAFNSAIIGATGFIYIPAGEYNLSSQVNLTGSVASIRGDGMGVTKLVWNSGDGFYVKPPAGVHPVLLKDLSLMTKASDSGIAYEYDGSNHIAEGNIQPRGQIKILVSDVEVKGYNGALNDGWNHGLVINSSIGAIVRGYRFLGKVDGNDSPQSDTALLMGGSGNPVEVTISDTSVTYAKTAIQTNDHEGVFVESSNLVAVNYGVFANSPDINPQLNISDSHFNCRTVCVWAKEMNQVSIKDTLFYARGSAPGTVTGILLTSGSSKFTVSGNSFNNPSDADGLNAIIVESDYGVISNNLFSNKNKGTSVWLKSTSSYIVGDNNICHSCGTKILNRGSPTNTVSFAN